MQFKEAWQLPAADDIDPDSLEYLLLPKVKETPWVKMEELPQTKAQLEFAPPSHSDSKLEIAGLKAKLELLSGQMELVKTQLRIAHVQVGILQAQAAYKDEQLESLNEYRARAAMAIAGDVDRDRLRVKVAELEAQLANKPSQSKQAVAEVPARPVFNREEFHKADDQSISQIGLGRTLQRYAYEPAFRVPLMPLIYLLVLFFAGVVLTTVLI